MFKHATNHVLTVIQDIKTNDIVYFQDFAINGNLIELRYGIVTRKVPFEVEFDYPWNIDILMI